MIARPSQQQVSSCCKLSTVDAFYIVSYRSVLITRGEAGVFSFGPYVCPSVQNLKNTEQKLT